MVKAVVETTPKHLPDGDLGTILGKALKKRPQERYASVTALADDLRRFLNHEPISARPDTLTYRGGKFVRRHRVGVAVAVAAVAGLAIALYAVNRQRAIAQRRFTEVRQLAAKLFDIDVRVRRLQGSSTTRQFIVDTSLEYLRRLTADAGKRSRSRAGCRHSLHARRTSGRRSHLTESRANRSGGAASTDG